MILTKFSTYLAVQAQNDDHEKEEDCPDLFQRQIAGHFRVGQEREAGT